MRCAYGWFFIGCSLYSLWWTTSERAAYESYWVNPTSATSSGNYFADTRTFSRSSSARIVRERARYAPSGTARTIMTLSMTTDTRLDVWIFVLLPRPILIFDHFDERPFQLSINNELISSKHQSDLEKVFCFLMGLCMHCTSHKLGHFFQKDMIADLYSVFLKLNERYIVFKEH